MKKKIVIILIVITSLVSCENKKELNNDLRKINVYGKVKQIKTKPYLAKESFGEIEKAGFNGGVYVETFNTAGNQIQEKHYNSADGSPTGKTIFKYNSQGLKTEKRPYNEKGSPYNYYIYSYNDNNLVKTSKYKDRKSGEVLYKLTFEYNGIGNLINTRQTLPRTKNGYVEKYKYDKSGNKIEYNYGSKGILIWITKYKYDDENRKLEDFNVDSNTRKMTGKTGYKYDNFDNIIERTKYNSDSFIKERTVFEYEYDKNNNWIKKTSFINETVKEIIEREIEYYK